MRRPWLSLAGGRRRPARRRRARARLRRAHRPERGRQPAPHDDLRRLPRRRRALRHRFEFAGGGGAFGSIIPLPGIPTKVERGGDWTLQRLVRETDPVPEAAFFALAGAADAARRGRGPARDAIDALDITILRGGGDEVGLWAKNHGFRLPPDAPEVLDFYADRSPIFMAAAFDADAAAERGQAVGDGTPVHLTIPTDNPWVPLRILGLGKAAAEPVEADVYLLTDERPALLPNAGAFGESAGLILDHSGAASDEPARRPALRRGHGVGPGRAWLTKVVIDATAGELSFDLAIDATGAGRPSPVDAGFAPFARRRSRGRRSRCTSRWPRCSSWPCRSASSARRGGSSPPATGRRWAGSARLAVAALLIAATVTAGCAAGGPVTVRSRSTTRASTSAITVPLGVPVTFVLVNEDPIDHEWLVGDEAFHERHRTGTQRRTATCRPRSRSRRSRPATTITFDDPGPLQYICHLPGHEAYGMVGTLTVGG